MELGTEELFIALGIIVVIAILFDCVRRIRRARYSRLRTSRRKQPIFNDDDIDDYGSELPSGPARVVSIRNSAEVEQVTEEIRKASEACKPKLRSIEQYIITSKAAAGKDSEKTDSLDADGARVTNSDLAETVPDVKDRVDDESVVQSALNRQSVADDQALRPGLDNDKAEHQLTEQLETEQAEGSLTERVDEELPAAAETDPDIGSGTQAVCDAGRDAENNQPAQQSEPEKKPRFGSAKQQPAKLSKQAALGSGADIDPSVSNAKKPVNRSPQEVIVFHVMAKKGLPFSGQALLDALMKEGLRYGSMKIFHRHEHRNGSGDVLFSMANMIRPGTFDLANMSSYSTSGVSFFIDLASVKRPVEAFALMLEAIATVIEDLGGILLDETRSTATRQTIEHYRQRVKEFERRSVSVEH